MDAKDFDLFMLTVNADDTISAKLTTYDNDETVGPEARVDDSKYLRDDIDQDVKALRAGRLEGRQQDIQRLGRNLYRAIFPDTVGGFFEGALKTVLKDRARGNKNRWLRVIIDVHPKSVVSLASWPLEFLYCQAEDLLLATEKPYIALSRHITHPVDLSLSRQGTRLSMLVVISKPLELGGVMSTQVLVEIGKLACTDSVDESDDESNQKQMDVKVLGKVEGYEHIPGIHYLDQLAKYENIRELISEGWKPHVLHFIGHGMFEQEGFLGFEDDDRKVSWCSAGDLTRMLTEWKPRLVLLQACQSAASGTEPAFMSLADRLFRRNIPAVVAMQFEITNDYATKFATGFYEALRDGKDVDVAVQIGRWKIFNEVKGANRDFGAPVLFTYNPDSIIQPRKSASPSYGQRGIPTTEIQNKPATNDRMRHILEKALCRLGDKGEAVDEELAGSWLEQVLMFQYDQLSEIKSVVVDALDCLRYGGGVYGAMKMVQTALGRVHKLATVTTQLRPASQIMPGEQGKGFESKPDQWKSQQTPIQTEGIPRSSVWPEEGKCKYDRSERQSTKNTDSGSR